MNYTVEYSDNLPKGIGGRCEYPWFPKWGTCRIVLRPKYINDTGILNHEIVHANQYKRNFFHGFMTRWSKKYRYKCELEAYTEQMREYGYKEAHQAMWIVKAIHEKYDLNIGLPEIFDDINDIIKRLNK